MRALGASGPAARNTSGGWPAASPTRASVPSGLRCTSFQTVAPGRTAGARGPPATGTLTTSVPTPRAPTRRIVPASAQTKASGWPS